MQKPQTPKTRVDDQAPKDLVERTMDLFGQPRTWAKAQLEGSYREHRARPAPPDVEFTWDWIAAALDEVDRNNGTQGNRPVRSWGWVHMTLEHFWERGGPPPRRRSQAPPPPPKPKAPPPPPPDLEELRRHLAELEAKEAAGTLNDPERRWIMPSLRKKLEAIAAGPGIQSPPPSPTPRPAAKTQIRQDRPRATVDGSVGSDTEGEPGDAPDGDGDAFPGFSTLARPPPRGSRE